MTKDEFKENINGLLIELTETNSVKYVLTNYYIRIYDFYKDISDYLLTLHDYLTNSGFEDVEFEIWLEEAIGEYEDKSHYVKVLPRKRDLSKIRKDITLFFKNTNRVITESKFVDQDELDELLDKISEYGIESISDVENKRLNIFSENDKSIIELIDKMGDITYDFKVLNNKMKELSSEGKDAKYLMKDWLELNKKMVPLEREIESYGIMLGDPRLTRLMKRERPDVYGDICESNKFENVKDVITNMNGILVDFIDLGFKYDIQPSDNDIKIKMVSFAKENIKVRIELLKKYDKSQIFNIVDTLNDYMEINNFKILPISLEGLGKTGSKYKGFNRHTFKNMRELEETDLDIVVLFLEYENMDKLISESLPRQQTVDQLKKLRKLTKGIDIGDRISDMNKQGANIDYIKNPIDTGIESFEDYEKKNKKFIPSWNLKHLLDPFEHAKKKKKKKK